MGFWCGHYGLNGKLYVTRVWSLECLLLVIPSLTFLGVSESTNAPISLPKCEQVVTQLTKSKYT
jgi:hypothetical protein